MRLPHRLRLSPARRRRLVSVARGEQATDCVIRAASMLDVYTGETRPADIGIAEGRIAWVTDIGVRSESPTLELDHGVVVPGFIEPHCHPDILYTPSALAGELTRHGTTTVCADTVFLSLLLDDDELVAVLRGMSRASVKFLWNLRGCLDGVLSAEHERLSSARLARLLAELPDVVATGEMTAWPQLLSGDHRLAGFVDDAVARGLRIDGHAAGASARTLGPLAAAGITADHEAITADELVERARLGFWLMLRHSSLRPDGPALAGALTSSRVPTSRVMLTTDGPVAVDLAAGHLDAVMRTLVTEGVAPVDAVRMVTLNPATYLGLDAHLGGIAPGRAADLVLVDSLTSLRPLLVVADGAVLNPYSISVGFTEWEALHPPPLAAGRLSAEVLQAACLHGPAMRLEGIITRLAPSTDRLPPDASYVALVARDGSAIVGGTLRGLAVAALASSFSGSGDVVLAGRDLGALVDAYRRITAAGGGLATHARTVPLDRLGTMFGGSVAELAAAMRGVAGDLRLPSGLPPVEYLVLFLTLAVLPDVRLTPRGAILVKTGEVLRPPVALGDARALERRVQ